MEKNRNVAHLENTKVTKVSPEQIAKLIYTAPASFTVAVFRALAKLDMYNNSQFKEEFEPLSAKVVKQFKNTMTNRADLSLLTKVKQFTVDLDTAIAASDIKVSYMLT